ncbi:MAG: efflux RND transporter periplasmic adaptor subunit [Steroidobacteraceae bacterium]
MRAQVFIVRNWLLALPLLALVACKPSVPDGQAKMVAPVPEVAVGVVVQGAAPLNLTYTAQTLGSREVEVRSRVSGILFRRLYQEGTPVKQGDVLFEIDPAPFEAVVAQDRAALAVARAGQAQARRNRDRILPLVEKGLASSKERDDALSAVEVADAQVQAAEASLRTAELNLSYTKVRAPIAGMASREARSEGSLVTAGSESSLLTRIVQMEPLYVEFAAPEQEAVAVRAALARLQGPDRHKGLAMRVEADAGETLTASLSFIDNAIDAASGTVRMRAVLANRERRLWPGQYVRVQFVDLTLANAITIPRRAVLSSTQGYMVWVLDANNSVQPRPVKLGRAFGEEVLISEGLQVNERYVLDGLFKVQPGLIVKPVEATGVATTDAGAQRAKTGKA